MISLLVLALSVRLHAAEIWLTVGEVRTLPAEPGAAVRVGSRGILRVVDGEENVRMIALKPGATPVVIGARAYQVRVSHGAQREFVREFRRELAGMMGLQFSLNGARPEVRGTLLRLKDWLRLAEVAASFNGEWVFRARPWREVGPQAVDHLQSVVKARGLPPLRFDPEFMARLPGGSKDQIAAAQMALAPYGLRAQADESAVDVKPLVRTQVVLAEVTRAFSRQFGLKWPGEYEAKLVPPSAEGDGLSAMLKALETTGEAQILASPTLTCRSGSEARFHAGGEFPVRLAGRTQAVVWKPHGVVLNLRPKADRQGAISIEIETEISLLDSANAVDGIPALKKNTVRSHFDLAGRRTIALSGLIRHDLGDSREGLPLLSRLPVLGPLFSSRSFLNRNSELVVFVTPEVLAADSDASVRMPPGWNHDP